MTEGRGNHFDPAVLDAFLARRDDIVEIQIALADTD
jgi:putative two-component system response regulator